jgi:hypothetical protein
VTHVCFVIDDQQSLFNILGSHCDRLHPIPDKPENNRKLGVSPAASKKGRSDRKRNL